MAHSLRIMAHYANKEPGGPRPTTWRDLTGPRGRPAQRRPCPGAPRCSPFRRFAGVSSAPDRTPVWLDVVLPCLDEAQALPTVLAAVPDGVRAVVVDNGSTDGSPEVAARLGATVVAAPRRGYGSACAAGLDAATAPVVAFADCDASVDLADVVALAGRVRDGEVDLVTTRRRVVGGAGPGGWPPHARLGAAAVARMLSRRARIRLRDVGPVRVARTGPLRELGVADRRSGYPVETVLRAALAGWRVLEADLPYRPRLGRSKVTGTVGGTLRAVHDMSRVLARTTRDVRG